MNHSFTLRGGPGLTPDAPAPVINLPGNLRERALLVKLSIKSWGTTRKDESATEAAQAASGAQRGTGSYTKQLVTPSALKPIKKLDGKLRAYLAENSLPWDDGKVMVPSVMFDKTMAEARALIAEREQAVAEFARQYPQHVAEAQAALGGLFDAAQYPAPEAIEREFSVRLDFEALPNGADFRCDLPADAVAQIRESIEQSVVRRFGQAHSALWERLRDAVAHMADKLAVPAGEKGGTFHDTLVTNLRELCAVLPGLNVAGDAELSKALAEISAKLAQADPDKLREEPNMRARVAAEAAEIERKLGGWLAAGGAQA